MLALYCQLSSILKARVDEDLLNELVEFDGIHRTNGMEVLRSVIEHEAESEGVDRVFIRVCSPGGEVLASSDMAGWKDVPVTLIRRDILRKAGVHLADFSSDMHPHGVRLACRVLSDGGIICMGKSGDGDHAFLDAFVKVSSGVMLLAAAMGAAIGWYISRRAMLGVERVRLAASSIGRWDTSTRVPLGSEGEEIENLAVTFNSMLDRIESLISDLRDVTDDIAHELRGPLTRIRGAAEGVVTGRPDPQGFQETAAMILEECDDMGGMINTMLEIARTDCGDIPIACEMVDVCELLRRGRDLFLPVAEDKGISLELEAPGSGLAVRGDTARLQRCISNLLDNALKFTGPGGRVVVSARGFSDRVEIAVEDTGRGIDPDDLPNIFKRFYRSDRSRSTPGSGLGLSLVDSIVRAHHGRIAVKSAPGEGAVFTVSLPRAS